MKEIDKKESGNQTYYTEIQHDFDTHRSILGGGYFWC